MTKIYEDFLARCIGHFGERKQKTVAIEEMAELTQAICKNLINHHDSKREDIVEEYSDVMAMMMQVKKIFDITDEEVEAVQLLKMKRLEKIMDESEYNNFSV